MLFRISRAFYLSFKCMTFLLGRLLKKKSKVNIIWLRYLFYWFLYLKNISCEIISSHLRFTRTCEYESDHKIFTMAKVAVVRICSLLRRSRFKELALRSLKTSCWFIDMKTISLETPMCNNRKQPSNRASLSISGGTASFILLHCQLTSTQTNKLKHMHVCISNDRCRRSFRNLW